MKHTNINVLKAAWMLITIFYSSLLWAQPFSGGDNSGAVASNAAATNCTAGRYSGSDNSGAASAATAQFDCTPVRFFGDAAAGSSIAKTGIFDCSPLRFAGDTAAGSSHATTNIYNCTLLRFSGDTSSGSKAGATNVLNCTNERFWGDTAGGFASSKYLLIRDFLGDDTIAIVVCSNETFNLLTLYTTPANLFYNWSAPAPTAAGLGVYTLIATNQSGCVDTAKATLQQEIAVWNGSVSNNWHTAANWNSNKIPGEKTHVIIPAATANPCQVSDSDAAAASVQAKASGSFFIINNRLLLISGTCAELPTGQ